MVSPDWSFFRPICFKFKIYPIIIHQRVKLSEVGTTIGDLLSCFSFPDILTLSLNWAVILEYFVAIVRCLGDVLLTDNRRDITRITQWWHAQRVTYQLMPSMHWIKAAAQWNTDGMYHDLLSYQHDLKDLYLCVRQNKMK